MQLICLKYREDSKESINYQQRWSNIRQRFKFLIHLRSHRLLTSYRKNIRYILFVIYILLFYIYIVLRNSNYINIDYSFPQKTLKKKSIDKILEHQYSKLENRHENTKLVFILIDGLRYDSIFDGNNKYYHNHMSFLRDNFINFHSVTDTPTATVSRIYSILTGLNDSNKLTEFLSKKINCDNLLYRLNLANYNVNISGDNVYKYFFSKSKNHRTLNKQSFLFENGIIFHEMLDCYSKDQIVQKEHLCYLRFLNVLKNSTQSSAHILHLNVLDSVGHDKGLFSYEIQKILERYNLYIKQISRIIDKNCLFVVLSDHGVTDCGQHGGNSFEETSSIFSIYKNSIKCLNIEKTDNIKKTSVRLFYKNKIKYLSIKQYDALGIISDILNIDTPVNYNNVQKCNNNRYMELVILLFSLTLFFSYFICIDFISFSFYLLIIAVSIESTSYWTFAYRDLFYFCLLSLDTNKTTIYTIFILYSLLSSKEYHFEYYRRFSLMTFLRPLIKKIHFPTVFKVIIEIRSFKYIIASHIFKFIQNLLNETLITHNIQAIKELFWLFIFYIMKTYSDSNENYLNISFLCFNNDSFLWKLIITHIFPNCFILFCMNHFTMKNRLVTFFSLSNIISSFYHLDYNSSCINYSVFFKLNLNENYFFFLLSGIIYTILPRYYIFRCLSIEKDNSVFLLFGYSILLSIIKDYLEKDTLVGVSFFHDKMLFNVIMCLLDYLILATTNKFY